jgi:predicted dehydrogenase
VLELADGPVARLTTNFYVNHQDRQEGMQFHGDLGSVLVSSWQDFDADVAFAAYGGASEPIPYGRVAGVDFGLALRELDAAIREDRPHAAGAERAAHVVETMCAIGDSAGLGRAVELQEPPQEPG